MPELPEVETIKNELLNWVVGQSFIQADILDNKLVHDNSVEEFCNRLIGQKIETLERRGKYLFFYLSNGQSLIMHLRMTGALLLNPGEIDRYARAVFHLSNGTQLVFSDRRRLGIVWLDNAQSVIDKLGPEPLDERFTPAVLEQALARHQIPIKAALLDQSIVAGIGNMYADETLFAAVIHPLRTTDTLSDKEIGTLCQAIKKVLNTAIDSKGASVDTYIRPDGQQGTAQSGFKVAHRKGESCLTCGTSIERITVRNRGTYFCPRCQPETT